MMAKDVKKEEAVINKSKLDLKATFWGLFVALYVSFVLCILAGILFGWSMYEAWIPLLPGFNWPVTPGGFLVGSLWILGYSIYFAALFVYPYNYIVRKRN